MTNSVNSYRYAQLYPITTSYRHLANKKIPMRDPDYIPTQKG